MIPPEKAWSSVVEHSKPLPIVRLNLPSSLDHVLAHPICADRDIPAADRAAMDGYAIRSEDVRSARVTLRVRGEVAAGSDARPPVGPGECVRIFTGANLPADTDTVVMVEDTECAGESSSEDDRVKFLTRSEPGTHIFRKGENASEGEELIPAGTRLDAMHISVCAAVGCGTLEVHRKPTVSVLTTGTELLDVNAGAEPHQTRNSNGPMLVSSLEIRGYEVGSSDSVADNGDLIAERIQEALDGSDVVLLTGGVSVGKYDLVPEAVSRAGGEIHFHRVAMKPGKPELFATTPEGGYIFGLPGNPLSAMTGFHEFVVPLLRRLGGSPPGVCRSSLPVRLTEALVPKADRQQYVLGRLRPQEKGLDVEIIRRQGSADLVAGAKAHGVVIVPPGNDRLEAGSVCKFRLWRALM